MAVNPVIKDRRNQTTPPGQPKTAWLTTLEQGANLLQAGTPLKDFDVYVVGFHCAKGEPDFQMEAHHFCRVVNNDLLQCVLFDDNTKDANLIGIEYIISERLFDTLPDQEKPYWHPHNFELLWVVGRPRAAGGRGEDVFQTAGQLLRQDLAHLAHQQP